MSNVPPQQPPGASSSSDSLTPENDRKFAMYSHWGGGAVAATAVLLSLISLVSNWSIPRFGGVVLVLPSLIIYLVYKNRGTLTAQESKEALNFQIFVSLVMFVVTIVLGRVLGDFIATGAVGTVIALTRIISIIYIVVYGVNLFLSWKGGQAVKNGGSYRYPILPLRLVK